MPGPAYEQDPLLGAVLAAERALETNPGPLLARLRQVWEAELTQQKLENYVAQARHALETPTITRAQLEHLDEPSPGPALRPTAIQGYLAGLPDGFDFPARLDHIAIDPSRTKFEEAADWFRWFMHGVRWWAGENVPFIPRIEKAPFRWHNHPAYSSRFLYDESAGQDAGPDANECTASCQAALFSDFGTGEYQSLYIAEQITQKAPDLAFHLGDVYYAGKQDEFAERFSRPLARYTACRPLYTLNENHEMISGSRHYFEYLDDKRSKWPTLQKQEGSYFAVRRPPVQFIGLDNVWHDLGRWQLPELQSWLESALREGRELGLINVLLTGRGPYDAGKPELHNLLERDLRRLESENLIDLWLWGHEHYCALFDRTPRTRFIGSCIGHGGFPEKRSKNEKLYQASAGHTDRPAPILFFERRARFPAWTNVRQDMSNHGYLMLTARDPFALELMYFDWMGYKRCTAIIERPDLHSPMHVSSVVEHDEG